MNRTHKFGGFSRKNTLVLAGSAVVLLSLAAPVMQAATRTKQNNTTDLNLAGSWDTLPSNSDIAQWTNIVTTANSTMLGTDLNLLGIKVVAPSGLVTLGAGNILTLGASGIDLSGATQNLILNCGLSLQGQQSWSVAAGRTLSVNGSFTRNAAVVDFTNFNSSATLGTLANDATGMLGPWATTGATTSLNYVKSTVGVIAAYTGQTAATTADLSDVAGPTTHYSFASSATQTAAVTGNTLRHTGSGTVLANAGFTTTLNGLMNAGSGALTISGAGNLVIGTNKELVITANAQTITISNPIVNNSAGASSLTYSGAGMLILDSPSTYSGGTTINSGILALTGSSTTAGSGMITMAGGTTFKDGGPSSIANTIKLTDGFVTIPIVFGGGADVSFNGLIMGAGGIKVTNDGNGRRMVLPIANTFSGGFILSMAGGGGQMRIQLGHVNGLGTGTLRSEITSGGGGLENTVALTVGSGVPNAIDLAAGANLNLNSSPDMLLSGVIFGTGRLTKNNLGTVTLSGVNTYAGTTTVNGGTLACSTNLSLGQGGLLIATGAKVKLNYSGSRRVSALTLNNVVQVAGTWGSTASTATNKNDTFFDSSSAGVLTVGPPGAATTTALAMTTGTTPGAVGSTLAFTATVAGTAPTGNVVFYNGPTVMASVTLNGMSQAVYSSSSLPIGIYNITAQYVGDPANEPSGSAAVAAQVANTADILTFVFPGQPTTTIGTNAVSVTVPYITNLTALAPTYTAFTGATGSPVSGTARDFSSPQSYTITGSDSTTKVYTVTVTKTVASTAKDILTFTFPGLPAPVVGTNTVALSVPFGTAVNALSPTYSVSPLALADATFPSGSTRDFTSAKSYTISDETGATKVYTVTVTVLPKSPAKDFLTFVFAGQPATTIGANTVAVTVPYATDVTALAPTYTVSSLASGNPISGSVGNFTSPRTYTITAEDASTKAYTVTVTKTAASTLKDILSCDFGALGAATLSGTTFTLFVPPSQSLTALAPTFSISSLATLSPASGSTQNFTSPVTYIVTAQDGSTKTYAVSVQTYSSWTYHGSMFISTTPDGANITTGTETNFPLLIRLKTGNFDFSQAQPDGRDIRFSTAAGAPLSYQIEQWDAASGTAAVWVKIPSIAANARQEIVMYWGKTGVVSESSNTTVFNAGNGYACVFHMNETVNDVVGTITSPTDTGTTLTDGVIGKGRNFTVGKGIRCGYGLTGLPQGITTHSTQAWFRTSGANCEIVDWGIDGGYNKVQIRLLSPPKIFIDGNFASIVGNVSPIPSQWHQVVHTYGANSTKIYVDGVLDAAATVTMNLSFPPNMWIGGWYDSYSFVGDMDEVRISNVTRSANWVKMEYENQKMLQTLVGNLVQAGSAFTASPGSVTINEGTSTTLTAQAGGAQKVYWILKQNGIDTIVATDQFTYNLSAPRSTGNQSYVIQFKAIYPTEIKTVDIPVTVVEDLPDPIFTLTASTTQWDGRQTMTLTPNISNLATLQAKGVANLNYTWKVAGVAVTKQITAGTPTAPGVLTLTRSQGSGLMTVSLVLDNGGTLISNSKVIAVQEPATDVWVQRTPGATEKPVNGQFFGRDPSTNNGTVFYNGTQSGAPATVYLKVYTTDTGSDVLYGTTQRQALVSGGYTFTVPIAAGKVTYKVVYGTTTGGVDTDVATVTDLVCGDAFIIEGQSNALATDNSEPSSTFTNKWIRTYGNVGAGGGWGYAINKGGQMQLGLWGWLQANQLLADNGLPVCIIQAAVGGTRIDQHRPNPDGHGIPGSLYGIYANLYNRVVAANLTHSIRAVLWHQGEQDQGSGGPDGDYDYKFYQQYFVDISASWKGDFPNIRNYFIFQIWPAACGDTSRNDLLREVQRTLPKLYSNMRVMTTVGVVPGSSCHYVLAGYQRFSDLLSPLIGQDLYGSWPSSVYTAPDLQRAYFTTSARNEIALEFSQNMSPWVMASKGLFFLDGAAANVSTGSVSGKIIKLQLLAASSAQTITYLKGSSWDRVQGNLVYGANSVAALTFAEVPLTLATPYQDWAASVGQGLIAGSNDGPLADPDRDGISNLLEFALGSGPLVASQAVLPKSATSGGNVVFEYDRGSGSRPPYTTQTVEYGSDLTGWVPVNIPLTSSGSVAITPGLSTDHVTVTLSAPGAKMFVRLKVSQ